MCWNPAKLYKTESTPERKRKRNKGQGPKSKPKRGEPPGGNETTKNSTFHQSHEAYQLKKGEVNLIKASSLRKPFPAITARGGKPNKASSLEKPFPAITAQGGKPNKASSLEKPFPAITAHLEIEAACVLCNATNTLCL